MTGFGLVMKQKRSVAGRLP